MRKITILRPVGAPRSSVLPVQDMIIEVLARHPEGMMLVPLHEEVDAELVKHGIRTAGCSYEQVRYSLVVLRQKNLILKTLVPRRAGHYKYCCKNGAAIFRERRESPLAKPDRRLSAMAFSLHALSQIPSAWDYEREYSPMSPDPGQLRTSTSPSC